VSPCGEAFDEIGGAGCFVVLVEADERFGNAVVLEEDSRVTGIF
jgi:hypothetical protein